MSDILPPFFFYILKAPKNSASLLIKTVRTEKIDQKDDRLWQNCYEVTWSAEIRRVTRILRCNNRHYRSSRRSRMYWARKLILRDAQFALGCDGSRMSRDSARRGRRIKTSAKRTDEKLRRGARSINYIIFVILVGFEISIYSMNTHTPARVSSCLWTIFLRLIKRRKHSELDSLQT